MGSTAKFNNQPNQGSELGQVGNGMPGAGLVEQSRVITSNQPPWTVHHDQASSPGPADPDLELDGNFNL